MLRAGEMTLCADPLDHWNADCVSARNHDITLSSLQRAAVIVGRRVSIELV
jgi:hypothetical protein